MTSNPDLKAFGYELMIEDGHVLQAGLAPNPELVVDVEDAFGTDDHRGYSAAQTTISLRQVLERGGLQKRIAAAEANRSVLEAELAEKQLEAAAETARRFVQLLARQAELEVTREGIRIATRTMTAVKLRVHSARSPQAELIRAEVALERARLENEGVEHALLVSKHQLAALWGESKPGFDIALGSFDALPDPESFSDLSARIRGNPALLKFASVERLRTAELRLAQQRRKPAWQVSAGIRRFENGDDYAAVLGIAMPLPWRNSGQGEIAAARARLAQVDVNRDASKARLLNHLFQLYQEMLHARHVVAALDTNVLPRVSEALNQTRHAYEQGRYGFLDLLAAQSEQLEVKAARVQAVADAYGYATEIEFLTGMVPRVASGWPPLEESSE